MGPSGKKLVFVLAGLALIAGVTSWWYRYEAAHRATTYWGKEAAPLIAKPARVEIFELTVVEGEGEPEKGAGIFDLGGRYQVGELRELTHARGMVHLRHALMSDRNFNWEDPVSPGEINWRWCLRFYNSEHEVRVVLAADLGTIGRVSGEGQSTIRAFSCRPMAESLQSYFEDLGLITASISE